MLLPAAALRELPSGPVTGRGLLDMHVARLPKTENYRTEFGRALNLDRIASAIRAANSGSMRLLTDLSRETMGLDGHLAAVAGKRINRLAAFPWEITADTERARDQRRAEEIAHAVRDQLKAMKSLPDRITDLNWALYDGRSALEIEWEYIPRSETPWRARDMHWVHPRRLSFGPERQLQVVDASYDRGGFQHAGFQLEEAPLKFVTYTPRLFGDYAEREGLSPRSMYWSWFARFSTRERVILIELFGRPWRILKVPPHIPSPLNDETVATAWQMTQSMSGSAAAMLFGGMELALERPPPAAGALHNDQIEQSNKTLSKLWLGSTGTTEAVPTGLGSTIGDAHLSEEDYVIAADARRKAGVIEHCLTDAIVVLNWGAEALVDAPLFKIRAEQAADRSKEIERVDGALKTGVELAAEEVYQRVGFRQPKPGEARIRLVQVPAQLGAPQQPPAARIIYPTGKTPKDPGEIAPEPSFAPVDFESEETPDEPTRAPAAPPITPDEPAV